MAALSNTRFQVESYVIPELATISPDVAESRLALINKLGLDGQKSLVKDNYPTLRFRRLTPLEHVVFTGLFPREIKIADYNEESIPLEVLQLVDDALAQGLHRPIILCPEVGQPDPVCVMHKDPRPYHDSERYLIARWGAPLLPFNDLIPHWTEKATARASKLVAEAQHLLAKVRVGPEGFSSPPNFNSLYI